MYYVRDKGKNKGFPAQRREASMVNVENRLEHFYKVLIRLDLKKKKKP